MDDVRVTRHFLRRAREFEPRHRGAGHGGDDWGPSLELHKSEERGEGGAYHEHDLDQRAGAVVPGVRAGRGELTGVREYLARGSEGVG